MTERVQVGGLEVAKALHRFVEEEALPGSGVDSDAFWSAADAIVHEFAPRNRELLDRREQLQAQIDDFHRAHPGRPDPASYAAFLREIGYLLDEPADFTITTSGVDTEVTDQAGPQLVVPLLNARFATNAANARWGSLYDALYGTDVIPESGDLARGSSYNEARGAEVIARGRALLDDHVPLTDGSHADATAYTVDDDGLAVEVKGSTLRLAEPDQLVGYRGPAEAPEAVVLVHHGLHLEILIDRESEIGRTDAAGVDDILLEAAVSTIMDLEDSVAAVDADDKVLGYRNWLQLMQGSLAEEVTKAGQTFTRTMNPDRTCTSPTGETVTLHGRALLFIRQVGPPDDHRRRAGPGRQRGPRGHPRRAGHHPRQPPRPARQHRAEQLPDRLDVRRQAQDARARGGRVHLRPVLEGRGGARPAGAHDQGRDHGRGAAHHAQPEGLHPGRVRPGRLHQHRASSTAPATRSTPRCRPGRSSARTT